tara:strand:- start:181 stop:423 length:243 start_codon:yes stop_codon:yes gene_type:complete
VKAKEKINIGSLVALTKPEIDFIITPAEQREIDAWWEEYKTKTGLVVEMDKAIDQEICVYWGGNTFMWCEPKELRSVYSV